jgi:cell division protein FtsW
MTKAHQPDYILIALIFILLIFGLVMVTSASIIRGFQDFGDSYYYAKHQLINGILPGLALFFIIGKVYYRRWIKFALPLLLLTFASLIALFIPSLGVSHGGAKRWLALNFFSFQPSEFAKISFIIYLAVWFDKKGDKIQDVKKTLLPFLVLLGAISILIISQPNLGMLSIIAISSLALYFIAGGKITHIISLFFGLIAALIIFIRMEPYRMNRFIIYLYPEMDPKGIGYQINQALLAIGSGGLFGMGLGWSGQKYNYLPEPFGDSIFAIIAEELGFIGVAVFIVIFMLFILRCFSVSKNAPDKFGRILAGGITIIIAAQFFMNVGAITRMVPLTGVPLPFISYGGSALISALIGAGIILNISRYTRQKSGYLR